MVAGDSVFESVGEIQHMTFRIAVLINDNRRYTIISASSPVMVNVFKSAHHLGPDVVDKVGG